MPVFTLTTSGEITHPDANQLRIEDFDILDGLQRTYRLWVVWKLIELSNSSSCRNYKELLSQLKTNEEGKLLLELDFVSVKLLRQLYDLNDSGELYKDRLLSLFANYDIIFAVWNGLSDEEVIKKMLILNAGQRSVSSVHQYELLFLHFFDSNKLSLDSNIHLYREKDKEYYRIYRGRRNKGEYTLASVIISLQSYIEGRPLRVDPSNKIRFDEEATVEGDKLLAFFNANYLSSFINNLYAFDCQLKDKGSNYEQWFGKDTTLSGIFAAIGAVVKEKKLDFKELNKAINTILSLQDPFNILEFDIAYSELSSVKVNVGKVLREAVFEYTKGLLTGNKIEWCLAFNAKM